MGKKNPAYYCYECLRKFGRRDVQESTKCPYCHCELRLLKNSRTRAQTVTRLARQRGILPPSRRRTEYEQYLVSDVWKEIRARVLERDNHVCRDCGGQAIQVHHLSYSSAVMAGEDDSQLVSLCKPCHRKKHSDKCRKKWQMTRRKRLVSGI